MAAEVSQRSGRIQPPLPGPFQLCRCCRSVAQGACPAQSLKTLGSTLLPRRVLAASRHFSSCDTAVGEGRGQQRVRQERESTDGEEKGNTGFLPLPGETGVLQRAEAGPTRERREEAVLWGQQEKDPQDSPAWLCSQVKALASSSSQSSW